MNTLVRGVVLAASVLSLSACESLITGGPLVRPGEPTGVITVSNASSTTLDVVLISDCEAGSYGLNRMPDGAAIRPGASLDFTVSAGCWDVDAGAIGVGEARKRMQVAAGGRTTYTVQ